VIADLHHRPEGALKIIEQLKPKIVIPGTSGTRRGASKNSSTEHYRSRFLDTSTITVSKETLPPATEIIVLKVNRVGDL